MNHLPSSHSLAASCVPSLDFFDDHARMTSATTVLAFGNDQEQRGLAANAIRDYDEAIKLDPKDALAYAGRGVALATKGDFDKALIDCAAALIVDPNEPFAYIRIAWVRATCPVPKFRNGEVAVSMATKACELTAWKDRKYLGVLAAAYAEQEDFANAVKWQTTALELATAETAEPDKQLGRECLELYRAGKPYRDEAKK
jgi:Flp pilus assembly protein TadD